MGRLAAFFDKPRLWLNGLLFALTVASTFVVGLGWSLSYLHADRLASDPPPALTAAVLLDPKALGLSLLYAVVLMAILLAHELGHYLTCRRYGIDASLPFFIPAPTLVGTMGAFIRIRGAVTRRRQLFDIGVAGPLAGFVLALPALAWGLSRSRVVPAIPADEAIAFGEPLLLKALGAAVFGSLEAGQDIILHPVAFAGWVGILVTALNLLPVGQLDGGHIIYALAGPRSRRLATAWLILFVVLAVFFWVGWFVWALLILVLGLGHPRLLDDGIPLGNARKVLAGVVLAVFLLSFIPDPVKGYDLITILRQIGIGI
ncbi:MAG: site-2 protease family protein [Candidatus Aminicenantes bacterium]|nr:site-2 protease family protein [Candidatus Aminicenantes bacterium]